MPVGEWWGLFCREDVYDFLFEFPRVPGNTNNGMFFLPPPVLELSFNEGLWSEINNQTGLLFDLGEEEEIDPNISTKVVRMIQLLAKKYKDFDYSISSIVGKSGDNDIVVSMVAKDFSRWLIELAIFLEAEALKDNKICVIF